VVELTLQETEKVICDFLASFSGIYDGVSDEEKGKALRDLVLDENEYDSEYDSDDSSSSGSRSLCDD